MRIGILTSVDTRHRYFVNRIRSRFSVVGIGYEQTGYSPADVRLNDLTVDERAIVVAHFEERVKQEERFFGRDDEFVSDASGCSVLRLPPGTLNSSATLSFLEAGGVDTLVVYGTNLIKSPLLQRWSGRIVNMHLGLSPYYRGTATNFYPLLNEEPEYVGATIHLIDAGIDSGPILQHARPEIANDDMPHTIGCKTIEAGIDAMLAVLERLTLGELQPVQQWEVPNARLYLRKDYHPRQVVELHRKIDRGLIKDYVSRAKSVRHRMRLIEEGMVESH